MSKLVPDDQHVSADDKVHLPVMKENETTSIRLSGTAINNTGQMTQHKYFDFLGIDLDDYSDIEYTPEEAKRIRGHLAKMSTGSTAMVPMICSPNCPFRDTCDFFLIGKAPFGRRCQPPGELILTKEHGYIPIELLEPETHSLIGYERRRNSIRTNKGNHGFSFKKASSHYMGNVYRFTTSSGKQYKTTKDHICIAKFNKKAIDKFCVYLMRKDNKWRIGKSKILNSVKNKDSIHKTYIAFANRGTQEKADAMWILGVYNTNAEATLNEDYFSCTFQTSKALFQVPNNSSRMKYDGVYAWATQEQLDCHHSRFNRSIEFYRQKLEELGLSIDYPIWQSGQPDLSYLMPEDTKLIARNGMYMRACNILTDIMDMPVIPDKEERTTVGAKTFWLAMWEPINITKEYYDGVVYSLDVEKHNTYFSGGIATHNCLIEVNLIREWTMAYFSEYKVDPNSFTEVTMINELAEIEVYQWRLNQSLARAENSELVMDSLVNMNPQGQAFWEKKISPYLQAKETLLSRKARLIKLMVGDRQEKYKREAALKQKEDLDPSSTMADLRTKLEKLTRDLAKQEIAAAVASNKLIDAKELSPEDIFSGDE